MEKAYQTCVEIFQQRGYNIIDTDDKRITAVKSNGDLICAFVTGTLKFNTDRTQEYVRLMNELNIKHSLIVYGESITSAAKKINRNLKDLKIELFSEEELQYNITEHRLQPNFELLSTTDAEELKLQFGTQFPTLLKTDPISRFYGYQTGDVIKINRKNGYVTYRIVRGS